MATVAGLISISSIAILPSLTLIRTAVAGRGRPRR